jgi:hypothetical protein
VSLFSEKPRVTYVQVGPYRHVRVESYPRTSRLARLWDEHWPSLVMLALIVAVTFGGVFALEWLTRGAGQ